jgi:hypothetical protein
VGSFEVLVFTGKLLRVNSAGGLPVKTLETTKYDMWAWQHDWKNTVTQARSRIIYFSDEDIGGSEKVPPQSWMTAYERLNWQVGDTAAHVLRSSATGMISARRSAWPMAEVYVTTTTISEPLH